MKQADQNQSENALGLKAKKSKKERGQGLKEEVEKT